MLDLPSGTVTFLFTDIEGSTRLLKQLRDRYAELLAEHQRLLREAFAAHGGREIDTQGDSFFVAFARARDAVLAAAEAQRAFTKHEWPDGAVPKVRMGLHTGEPIVGEDRYVGLGVHRAARVMAAGHGGQVLLSEATAAVLADEELPGIALKPLGEHRLKDLDRPERIYQLQLEDLPTEFPRLKTLEAQPEEATPFEGREGELAEAAQAAVAPRRRRIDALLAVGVLVAAGAVTALVLLVGRSGEAGALSAVDANAVGVIDGASRRLASQVEIGTAPSRVAAGEGAIWVTNGNEQSIARIDPVEGDVRETIEVGADPSGIVVGNGAVWVANGLDATVSRIDPRTSEVVQTVQVGNGPAGMAFGEDSIWVANRTDGTVTRLNARTGRPLGTFPAGRGAIDLVVGSGSVWVSGQDEARLVQLDARTGGFVRSVNVGNAPSGVAFGAGSVWVTNGLDGTVSRLDPKTGNVTATIPVGEAPNDVAVGREGVWVSNEFSKTVSLIDPDQNDVVETIELGNLPTGLAAVGESVWVAVRASGAAHRGGRLTFLTGEDEIDSLDPALAYALVAWSALITTNDGLVAFKRVGGSAGGQLVPDLATSLPAPAQAGKTYTFELRPGIRYSTGAPVKASDVRTAIERVFRLESPGRSFYSQIVGVETCFTSPSGCDLDAGIATDDEARRITFRLTAPDPEFLHKLALPFAFAVPSHRKPGVQPATGPYKIAAHTRQQLRLVRNPHFKEWSRAAQPDGYPDELVWRFDVPDTRWVDAIQRGEADVIGGYDAVPVARLEELRTQYASQLHTNPTLATGYVFLNTRVPPFDDVRARRALNYAIDREEVIRLTGGPDRVQLTCQVLPPNLPGYLRYCPYTLEPNAAGAWTAPDTATARQLIAKTRAKGTRVTFWWPTFFGREPGRYLVRVLRDLGYRASLKLVADQERYFTTISDSRNRIQAAGVAWIADYASESKFFRPNLTCEAFIPGSPIENTNYAQFCDPSIDADIARADELQAIDPHAASQLWAKIDQKLVDRAPWVSLYNPRYTDFVSERIGNYQHHPQWGLLVDQLWLR